MQKRVTFAQGPRRFRSVLAGPLVCAIAAIAGCVPGGELQAPSQQIAEVRSALTSGVDAGMAMLVTHTAAAAGATAWMVIEWVKFGKPSVLGIVTGMVAGLGTITPASGFVGPMGAVAIGLTAGVVCFFATQFMKRKLNIDDSLDVFPVHGVGGFTGLLLTAVFSSAALDGLGLPDGVTIGEQLLTQLIGAVATLVWSGAATFVILKIVNLVAPLRASRENENEGLDLALHGENGYSL